MTEIVFFSTQISLMPLKKVTRINHKSVNFTSCVSEDTPTNFE